MRNAAALLTVGLIALGVACGDQPAGSAPLTCPALEPIAASRCDAFDGECSYVDPENPGDPCMRSFTAVWTCSDGLWRGSGQPAPGKCAAVGDSGTTNTCVPGDVSTFTPSWKPPTAFNQGRCSDTQISAFVDCLSGMPDAASCKTFGSDGANKACIECAATPSTSALYGPLVEGTVTIDVNVAGCIARATNDLSASSCGAHIIALDQCKAVACEANCPVPANDDGTAFAALLACESNAAAGSCKPFADAAACGDALTTDGGTAAQCNQRGTSFADNAIPMIKLFCGGIATIVDDAGAADAGDGG